MDGRKETIMFNKKLKTEKELPVWPVLVAMPGIYLIYFLIMNFSGSRIKLEQLWFVMKFVLTVDLLYLIIWIPGVLARKIALIKGKEIECEIITTKYKKRRKMSVWRYLRNDSHTYAITIKYKINGETRKADLEGYFDNPREYLPKDFRNRKYKIYLFMKKIYIQDLYYVDKSERDILEDERIKRILLDVKTQEEHKEEVGVEVEKNLSELNRAQNGKYDNAPISVFIKYPIDRINELKSNELVDALEERSTYSFVKSNTYIIARTHSFEGKYGQYIVFCEIHMRACIPYSERDFDFYDRVDDYLETIEESYIDDIEEKVNLDIYRIVRKSILTKDSGIVIKKIIIMIRKW